jgi:hypothetical protein
MERFSQRLLYIFLISLEFKTAVARDCANGLRRFGKIPSADVTMFGIRFTDKTFKSLKKQKKNPIKSLRAIPGQKTKMAGPHLVDVL